LKWDKLNTLIGDATGGKFRKIAQSYVLVNLINSANYHLKNLTDRYKLIVKPGTFLIELEDAYNGFTLRPATTISGGESFLVSLSLALALSDMGQHLSLDILFIDEGFGSLSKDVLQTAIETLGLLHKTLNKHVGVISHVEELQERIPVQIKVKQNGNTSSSQIEIVDNAYGILA
jgi:exonuclease SbcC